MALGTGLSSNAGNARSIPGAGELNSIAKRNNVKADSRATGTAIHLVRCRRLPEPNHSNQASQPTNIAKAVATAKPMGSGKYRTKGEPEVFDNAAIVSPIAAVTKETSDNFM